MEANPEQTPGWVYALLCLLLPLLFSLSFL